MGLQMIGEKIMKAIKVVLQNKSRIEDALKSINGSAYDHTYTSYFEIDNLAKNAEICLGCYLGSVSRYAGAVYKCTSGEPVARSYKFTRRATTITLERKSSGWYLVDVEATIIHVNGGKKEIFLTPEQDVEAVANLRKTYKVSNMRNIVEWYRMEKGQFYLFDART